MDLEGWHPDPVGTHEERFFKQGQPTPLVRDGGVGSYDEPPASVTTATPAPTRAAARATSTPPPPSDSGSSRGPGPSEGDRKKRNPPQQDPNDQPAPPTPPTTKVAASSAKSSRPSLVHRALPRNWWLLVTAVIVVIIIISVVAVSGKKAPNTGTGPATAFCIKAPHDTTCPDSLLRSQEALLHDFWEAYLTGSACYPQKCPANRAELLLAAASTAKKWLPEVEGGRATTSAARALHNEIAHVLATANAAHENNGAVTTTGPAS